MGKLEEEYRELDLALSYWGDQELHDMIKDWYNKLKTPMETNE